MVDVVDILNLKWTSTTCLLKFLQLSNYYTPPKTNALNGSICVNHNPRFGEKSGKFPWTPTPRMTLGCFQFWMFWGGVSNNKKHPQKIRLGKGGFLATHLENIIYIVKLGSSSPKVRGKNKKKLKPPPRIRQQLPPSKHPAKHPTRPTNTCSMLAQGRSKSQKTAKAKTWGVLKFGKASKGGGAWPPKYEGFPKPFNPYEGVVVVTKPITPENPINAAKEEIFEKKKSRDTKKKRKVEFQEVFFAKKWCKVFFASLDWILWRKKIFPAVFLYQRIGFPAGVATETNSHFIPENRPKRTNSSSKWFDFQGRAVNLRGSIFWSVWSMRTWCWSRARGSKLIQGLLSFPRKDFMKESPKKWNGIFFPRKVIQENSSKNGMGPNPNEPLSSC